MKMSLIVAAASVLGMAPVLSPAGSLHAAELKVLAGGSLRSVLTELGPQFEAASGHKLAIHFDTTPNLIKAATTGEPFDLGVVPIDVFKDDSAKSPRLATVGTGLFLRKAAVIALADPRVTAVSAEPQMSALGDLDAQVMDASGYSDSDER